MKRDRRAIMLVELLFGLLVAAGVVIILGLVMTRLFAFNTQAQEHHKFLANLGRLSQQFRRDVHSATGATLEAGKTPDTAAEKLALAVGSRTVIYSLAAGSVERAVSEGEKIAAREVFELPGFKPLALDLDQHRREVELTIGRLAHPTDSASEVSGRFSILAVLRNQPKAKQEQP